MATSDDRDKGAPPPQLDSFLVIRLDQCTAENALTNLKVTAVIAEFLLLLMAEAVVGVCDKSVGNLLYIVATKYLANALVHRPIVIKYIVRTEIKNPAQLDAAPSFLSSLGPDSLDIPKFEEVCSVATASSEHGATTQQAKLLATRSAPILFLII